MKKSQSQKISWIKAIKLALPIIALGLSSLLFVGCDTEDLDFIEPFQLSFANEFDPIVPPTITEKEITVKTPVPSQVVIPERAGKIIPGLDKAVTKEDVDKELEPVTPVADAFIEQSNPTVVNTLVTLTNNLTVSNLNNLQSGSATLGQDAQNLFATAEAFSTFAQFLPSFTPGTAGGRMTFENENIELKLKVVEESLRIMNIVGPCRDAANNAYQPLLAALNQTRTTNQNTINGNRATRDAAIQTRFNQRNAKALADYNQRWTFIYTLFDIYTKQFNLLDVNQRYYLSLFIYCLVDVNVKSYNFDLQINSFLRQQELFESETIFVTSSNALIQWYNAEKKKLDDDLARLLSGCHNQGTGN